MNMLKEFLSEKGSKGVSDAVATTVIIVVAVSSVAMLYSWVWGYVSNQQGSSEQTSSFTKCEGISFIQETCSVEPGIVKIKVKSLGKREIPSFEASFRYADGNVLKVSSSSSLGAYGSNVLVFSTGKNELPEEIILYPTNCTQYQIVIEKNKCTFSNIGSYTLDLTSSGNASNFNNTTQTSSGITLSQTTNSNTITDFSGGAFYYSTIGSVKSTGELDYAGSLPNDLVMYLKMNEIISGKITDATGYSNDAFVNGTVSLSNGLWGTNALNTDGSSSNYLKVLDSDSLDTEELTISFWIKPNSVSQGTIISKEGAYKVYIQNGYIIAEVNGKTVKAKIS